MKPLLAAVITAASLVVQAPCGAEENSALTLDQALARARSRAPAIIAALGTVDEARGRLVGASVLLRDNPEVEGAAGSRLTDRGTLFEAAFGVRQTFELGGRRGARIAGATAAVERESAQLADVTQHALRETATVFWDALYSAERQRVRQNAVHIAEEMQRIAERRLHAGDVGPLDVNVATTAVARARSDMLAAKAVHDRVLGALRVVLGMDASEPLSVRGDLRARRSYVLAELVARAAERPDLAALEAGAREAEADTRLGRALEWPNLGLGATYERDDGNNIALGLVTLTLPVFERGQGLRAESQARRNRLQFELDSRRRALDVEVRTAFETYAGRVAAVEEIERNALPALEDNEALARRSYEVGQLSLAEWLVIRREALETRLEYLDRLHEAALAGVDLEASAGVLQ